MRELASLNSRIVRASEARVAALTQNAFYGRGVWTTIAVFHAQPFLWSEHYARLCDHAHRIGVSLDGWSEERLRRALDEVIAANKLEQGRARVMLLAREGFDEHGRRAASLWTPAKPSRSEASSGKQVDGNKQVDNNKRFDNNNTGNAPAARRAPESDTTPSVARSVSHHTDLLIAVAASAPARQTFSEATLAVTVSPYRTNTLSPLVGLKTTNYLEHILAWQEARSRDFDEAVRLNERGEIVSATLANIFWVKDATLYTPALATGALAGTTRAALLNLAARLNIPAIEVAHDLAHLADADEIFLTSAGKMIAPVAAYDFHRYTTHAGSITAQLKEALRQMMREV